MYEFPFFLKRCATYVLVGLLLFAQQKLSNENHSRGENLSDAAVEHADEEVQHRVGVCPR